mmetsp:Transcript_77482/g.250800  ORF Transcript_77482/g.250800 Transcript_77482/m.250800 type:complete len:102 (-) Transcript_77482:397-702(-)
MGLQFGRVVVKDVDTEARKPCTLLNPRRPEARRWPRATKTLKTRAERGHRGRRDAQRGLQLAALQFMQQLDVRPDDAMCCRVELIASMAGGPSGHPSCDHA